MEKNKFLDDINDIDKFDEEWYNEEDLVPQENERWDEPQLYEDRDEEDEDIEYDDELFEDTDGDFLDDDLDDILDDDDDLFDDDIF